MTTDPTVPEPTREAGPESFADLPIQPTGSGVADLEIAYEQMTLSDGVNVAGAGPDLGVVSEDHAPAVPTETDAAAVESAAHPS